MSIVLLVAGAQPAATMLVAGLLEDAMKIEIEVTAKKGSARSSGGEQGEEVLLV